MLPPNRILLAMLLAGCISSLSACVTKGNHRQVGSTGPLDCTPFIDAGSALALEIASYDNRASCETRYGPQGGYVEALGTTGLAKALETEATKDANNLLLIYRYYDWDEGLNPVTSDDIKGDKNFRVLTTDLPIDLLGAEGPGRVARFEAAGSKNMTHVCVTGITKNPNGSRTLVERCRPVGKEAGDDAVMAIAAEIATTDFSVINP
jgi:hypothetical protein